MTTTSYPAVGTNGLSENQWSILFGDSDGIVEDYHTGGVAAFRPTASSDSLTIGVGKIRINGYILSVDAAETFTLAASGSTITWYVAAVYDPALNVAQASGDANPLGPCRLTVTQNGPDLSGGKVALTLFRIPRAAGQTLAAALTAALLPNGGDLRSWVGPTIFMNDYSTDDVWPGFGPWPRGTRLVQANRNGHSWINESFRVPSGSDLVWQSRDAPAASALPMPGGLVSRDAAPSTPQYLRLPGNMIKLRGAVKRSSGTLSTGSAVVLATMPVGCRPPFTERYLVKAQGTGGPGRGVEVYINNVGTTDGQLVMVDNATDIDWIDISSILYQAVA